MKHASSPSVPRVAVTKAEAAHSLGVSVDYLEDHILRDLRVIRRGRLVLIPMKELERWTDVNAALTVPVGR